MAEELKPRVSKSVLLDDVFEPEHALKNLADAPEIARTTAEPPKIVSEDPNKNRAGQVPTKSEGPKMVEVPKAPEATPPQPINVTVNTPAPAGETVVPVVPGTNVAPVGPAKVA